MSDDLKSATEAWSAAKAALTTAETDLAAAKAGHDVAIRCEREAWERIAKLCGREPGAQPPIVLPSQVVATQIYPPTYATGRLIQQFSSGSSVYPQQFYRSGG
jgi:hypothetical protein